MKHSRPFNIINDLPHVDRKTVSLNNAISRSLSSVIRKKCISQLSEWTHLDSKNIDIGFEGLGKAPHGNSFLLALSTLDSKTLGGFSLTASFSKYIVNLATSSELRATNDFDRGFLSVLFHDILDTLLAHAIPGLQIFMDPSTIHNVRHNPDLLVFRIRIKLGKRDDLIFLHLPVDWECNAFDPEPVDFPLPLRLPIIGGFIPLDANDIANLQPGDLLLPDHGIRYEGISNDSNLRPVLKINDETFLEIDLDIQDGKWTCTFLENDKLMDNSHTHKLLNNADIQVRVRVGEVEMPLREVGKIKPGFILELKQGIHEGVELEANGKVFAKGELVNIDGRLGVRVRSLLRES